MQCRLRVPFWPIPSSDLVLPTFTLRSVICDLCLDDAVRTAFDDPEEQDGPVLTLDVSFLLACRLFCTSTCMHFFYNFPCSGPGQGFPTRSPSWLDLGLWALGSAAVWNLDPLACLTTRRSRPLLILNSSVFSISPSGFIAQRRICLGTLARHPIRPTCCPMRRIHHGIRL